MLFKLLMLPVSGPVSGMGFIFKKLLEMAETELYDVNLIRERLLLLQLQLEEKEISEDEYKVQEAEIMERLRAARAYHEAKAAEAAE